MLEPRAWMYQQHDKHRVSLNQERPDDVPLFTLPDLLAALREIRQHVDYDDGQGNNDASVLRGRLAIIKDLLSDFERQMEGEK